MQECKLYKIFAFFYYKGLLGGIPFKNMQNLK